MCQIWAFVENDHAEGQAEQAEEVRHGQVEEEALRDGGPVQMPTQLRYHCDVSRDTKQANECNNHTSKDVAGPEGGGQRCS